MKFFLAILTIVFFTGCSHTSRTGPEAEEFLDGWIQFQVAKGGQTWDTLHTWVKIYPSIDSFEIGCVQGSHSYAQWRTYLTFPEINDSVTLKLLGAELGEEKDSLRLEIYTAEFSSFPTADTLHIPPHFVDNADSEFERIEKNLGIVVGKKLGEVRIEMEPQKIKIPAAKQIMIKGKQVEPLVGGKIIANKQ